MAKTISTRYKLVLLTVLSGLFTSFYVVMDVYFQNVHLDDPIAYGILTEWIGVITSVPLMFLLTLRFPSKEPLGKHLDPMFKGFAIPRGKSLYYLLGAGISMAFTTIAYFYLTAISDPSIVVPFSKLVIVYLIIIELAQEKDTPTIVEVLAVTMILVGLYIVSYSGGQINFWDLMIILGPYNLGAMFFTYFQKKAREIKDKDAVRDSLNLRFWALFFLTVSMTILLLPFTTFEQWGVVFQYSTDLFAFVFITLNMYFAFLSYAFYIRALGIGKMSIVNALTSISVVFSMIITVLASWLMPWAFGDVPLDMGTWIFKILGAILIVEGIVALSISQEKAYLLVKLSYPSHKEVIEKLKKIKGVKNIYAVAGTFDLILRIEIRSIAKVYNSILREVEKIDGIKEVTTMTIIKEWSKI